MVRVSLLLTETTMSRSYDRGKLYFYPSTSVCLNFWTRIAALTVFSPDGHLFQASWPHIVHDARATSCLLLSLGRVRTRGCKKRDLRSVFLLDILLILCY